MDLAQPARIVCRGDRNDRTIAAELASQRSLGRAKDEDPALKPPHDGAKLHAKLISSKDEAGQRRR